LGERDVIFGGQKKGEGTSIAGLTPDAAENDVGGVFCCEFAGIRFVEFLDGEHGGDLGPRVVLTGEAAIAVVGGGAGLTFLLGEGIHELQGFRVQDLDRLENTVGFEAGVGAVTGNMVFCVVAEFGVAVGGTSFALAGFAGIVE